MSDVRVINNIKQEDAESGMSQLVLRIVGLLFTAVSEFAFSVPAFRWARTLCWPAFAIFAYLLNEGFYKTGNRMLYGRRLFIFALISEPFYNLLHFGKAYEPSSQNIIFTLFMGYLGIAVIDGLRRRYENTFVTLTSAVFLSIFCSELGGFCLLEMHKYGFMLIFMFNIAEHITYTKLLHFAAAIYLIAGSSEYFSGMQIKGIRYEIPVQITIFAGLILIWNYRGNRGLNTIAVKRIYYMLYPSLLFILWLIKAAVLPA